MDKRIRIHLTQPLIDQGVWSDPELHPIALAVYNATEEEEEIRVIGDKVYIGEPESNDLKVYYLPYDSDGFDSPISFDMILKEDSESDYQLQNGAWEPKDDNRDYRIEFPDEPEGRNE